MRTLTPFDGYKLCGPFREKCLKHHGRKGYPGVTPETYGDICEKAQVILMWVRAMGVEYGPNYIG
jgi:hypothetical protein